MQKLISILLFVIFLLPNYLQAQEFENVLWWKALDGQTQVVDVAISPDGKYFLSLTDKLQVWDANTGDFLLDCELDNYLGSTKIRFSSNSKFIYTKSEMKESDFAIWETETGKIYKRFSFQTKVDDVIISNDCKRIAFLDHHDIVSIYDIETQGLIASKQLNKYVKGGITYSPDDKYILYGWRNESRESHGIYWLDANTLKIEKYMPQHAHETATSDVEFSRNGKYMLLFTGNYYGEIPTAIYTYPEMEETEVKVDKDTLLCANFYLSPVTDEVVVDGQPYGSAYRHFYVLSKKNVKLEKNKILPYIPFLYLRDTDTSGQKMPGFRARVTSINTKDTIGVFLPPWNKTKVKEKETIKEDKIYPNPSTNAAEITFSLANAEDISVLIYDNSGRVIQTLHQGLLEAGEHTFSWDCSNVSAGKYICNIRGNSVFRSMKVMVVK